MSMLPRGFEALEPFVAQWAIEGSNNRALQRDKSTEDERLRFYKVGAAALQSALGQLDGKPLSKLDESERRLLNLLLSLAHVALAVEAQGDAEAAHASARRHLPITRSPADIAAL